MRASTLRSQRTFNAFVRHSLRLREFTDPDQLEDAERPLLDLGVGVREGLKEGLNRVLVGGELVQLELDDLVPLRKTKDAGQAREGRGARPGFPRTHPTMMSIDRGAPEG